ncbi:GDSL-type esterase/lipase family protein [Longitalea arenae]|uniref:GDSL-type esterase/lipase family protein n=1 Tax=Longitalea arenae TaxID=2812558 RepID=UPI001966F99F|nr:GDSL-type esterase/lipase family protein [Longitalea arenae]
MQKTLLLSLGILLCAIIQAQPAAKFESEIKKFEKADSITPPAKQQVLFIGSSSFRLWNDFSQRFKGYAVINRGFGGAELADVTRYARRILIPYRPSKVFIYAGENDIGHDQSAEAVFKRFLELFELLSAELPDTRFYFISVKPSPSRLKYKSQLEDFNKKVNAFIKERSCNWTFIDVYHPMLAEDGSPKADIFRPDKLHMNSKGYDIWEKLIKKHM